VSALCRTLPAALIPHIGEIRQGIPAALLSTTNSRRRHFLAGKCRLNSSPLCQKSINLPSCTLQSPAFAQKPRSSHHRYRQLRQTFSKKTLFPTMKSYIIALLAVAATVSAQEIESTVRLISLLSSTYPPIHLSTY
jgi:hypothetical protein